MAIPIKETAPFPLTRGRATCDVFWIPRNQAAGVSALDLQTSALNLNQLTNVQGGKWLKFPDGRSAVAAANWQKDTESPAGTFSMTLYPADDYGNLIGAGDILVPYMGNQYGTPLGTQQQQTLISPIIVESPEEGRSISNNATTTRFHIHGRDWGKILQGTKTIFDPAFGNIANAFFNAELLTTMRRSFSGSPSEMVLHALDVFYNTQAQRSGIVGTQFQFPGSKVPMMTLLNLSKFIQAPMFGYSLPRPLLISEAGNVWNLLQTLRNKVVNEMFIDVRDVALNSDASIRHSEEVAATYLSGEDAAAQQTTRTQISSAFTYSSAEILQGFGINASVVLALIFRQYPYDTDTFNLLPVVALHETEVYDENTAMAEHEVYNFFRMRSPNLPPAAQELMIGIKVNPVSMQAYGIRAYEGETTYPFATSTFALDYAAGRNPTTQPFTPAVFDYYNGVTSTWYAYNERLRNGSINCRFRPDIRVGMRLRYGRTARDRSNQITDYYIQGVSHNFSDQAGSSRTHLTLVRGVIQETPAIRPEAGLYWGEDGPALTQDPYQTLREALLSAP